MRNDRPIHPTHPRRIEPRPPRTGAHETPRIVERRALERVMAQRCADLPTRMPGRRMSLGEELFVRLSIGSQG